MQRVLGSLIALWALILGAGCAEAAVMAGNGASMVVACLLLWSTVTLGQRGFDDEE